MRSTPVRIVVAALSCAACSSTGTTPAGTTPAPVSVYAQSGGANAGLQGVTLVTGGTAQTTTLTATREAIWPHLVGAYASLGIPLTQQDEATFKLGNTQLKARRALNNLQLRTALECGSDLAGEKAESYELRITIESSLATAGSGTGTELTTSVSAVGRSASVSGSDVSCSTKGEFERRIQRYVRAQLGLPGK